MPSDSRVAGGGECTADVNVDVGHFCAVLPVYGTVAGLASETVAPDTACLICQRYWGGYFGACLRFTCVTTCRVCSPLWRIRPGISARPTGLYSRLPMNWSPASPPDIATVATGEFALAETLTR